MAPGSPMRRRTLLFLAPIALAPLALGALSCRPAPIEVAPFPETPPEPPPPVEILPAKPLQVAGPATRATERRMITVDARQPRTRIGRYPAGTRVRLSIVDTRWNHDPAAPFFGAAGHPRERCQDSGHACVGGDGAAPLMGLILLTTADDAPTVSRGQTCAPRDRLFIPNGVEFAVPEETSLALSPNDWGDGLADNAGSIQVQVEVSSGKGARGRKWKVDADARRATPIGTFTPGQYVKISVLGGRWKSDPHAPLVSAGGLSKALCQASGGHLCAGGNLRAPSMGLILLVSPCAAAAPERAVTRRYIPEGGSFTLSHGSELSLGPNDWEDGCGNNAGAAIVDFEAELP
jgi:hypothetical protein